MPPSPRHSRLSGDKDCFGYFALRLSFFIDIAWDWRERVHLPTTVEGRPHLITRMTQTSLSSTGKVYPCSRWLLCKRNFNEKKQQKKGKSHELEKVDVFIK